MADPLARLASRRMPSTVVHLAADPADSDRLAAATAAASEHTPEGVDALDDLDRLRASIVTIDITLRAIGATQLDELIAEHPPTAAQVAAAKAADRMVDQFDMATFGPALLAATVERLAYSDAPDEAVTGLDDTAARQVWTSLPSGDRDALFLAARMLCHASSVVGDLGKG